MNQAHIMYILPVDLFYYWCDSLDISRVNMPRHKLSYGIEDLNSQSTTNLAFMQEARAPEAIVLAKSPIIFRSQHNNVFISWFLNVHIHQNPQRVVQSKCQRTTLRNIKMLRIRIALRTIWLNQRQALKNDMHSDWLHIPSWIPYQWRELPCLA